MIDHLELICFLFVARCLKQIQVRILIWPLPFWRLTGWEFSILALKNGFISPVEDWSFPRRLNGKRREFEQPRFCGTVVSLAVCFRKGGIGENCLCVGGLVSVISLTILTQYSKYTSHIITLDTRKKEGQGQEWGCKKGKNTQHVSRLITSQWSYVNISVQHQRPFHE